MKASRITSPSSKTPIRSQIFYVNIIIVFVTIGLTLGGTLYLTLKQNRQILDRNMMNSAQVIARIPIVIRDLEAGEPSDELYEFLTKSITHITDIDIISVADLNNIQYYYPDPAFIGKPYAGLVQQRILDGESAFTSKDTGISGAERCAYAPIHGENGELVGFVMVGIYMRSVTHGMTYTVISFVLIAIAAIGLGAMLSLKLSERIKRTLLGYEPEAFLGMFHQREDVLEALEEGLLSIDGNTNLVYMNGAAAKMMGIKKEDVLGKPLHEVNPHSTLDRILRSKRSEHNVPMTFLEDKRILADRMPIWEDGRVIGVLAILRNRTEVTKLAKDLTGVRHMVDALRAYTHEFMNKLHVILGLIHLDQVEKAEAYIMDVTSIQRKAVGAIINSVEDASVAALLVGKTSHCAEMGIRLTLGAGSSLKPDEKILPTDACVTILGNLIDNSIDALNQCVPGLKEIIVSLQEDEDNLLICVEDTGPGMEPEIVENIFKKGFSTKSGDRGTGLSLVQAVVTAYQGEIRVESELSVGTTFLLTFQRNGRKGKMDV